MAGADRGPLQVEVDLLTDHSIKLYAGHVAAAVEQERLAMVKGRGALDNDDLVIRHGCEEPGTESPAAAVSDR